MRTYLFYVKSLVTLLTDKSVAVIFTQQLSNSATHVLTRYLLLISLAFSPGCYLNASISDLNPKNPDGSPVFKVDNPGGSEFVSGSDQYLMTQVRRYQIMSSSGSYNREIKVKTPKGYSLYSSVQGALISGQEGVR